MKTDRPDRRWVFFGLFVLSGGAAMMPFIAQAVRDIRIMTAYEAAECTVLSHRRVPSTTVFRWQGGGTTERTTSRPEFTFAYRAGGREQVATGFDNLGGKLARTEDLQHLRVGGKATCWYDPARPEEAVLVRRVAWRFYLGALIPAFFMGAGGYFMKRALNRTHDYGRARVSDGRSLPHRLHPEMPHRRLTGCLLVLVVGVAMGMAGVWAVPWGARTTELASPGAWLFAGLLAVEVFLIKHFARAARVAQMREPEVEIGEEPLRPGQKTALRVTQGGPLRTESFQILLVCEEVASGTRTPVRRVLADAGALEIGDERATSARIFELELAVPAQGRPSQRELQFMRVWQVRVLRKVDGQTTLESRFPFRVLKAAESEGEAV
jgi:hypothetical protein